MHFKLRELDPLDRELVERALESAWATFKGHVPSDELDSDEALEANLRRELIEIALVNGARDAETLRDILVATRPEVIKRDTLPPMCRKIVSRARARGLQLPDKAVQRRTVKIEAWRWEHERANP